MFTLWRGGNDHFCAALGEIGATALALLLGHPDLDHVSAVLEVPGDGDGPRESDMIGARAIYAEGLAARLVRLDGRHRRQGQELALLR